MRNVFPADEGRIWVVDSQAAELRLFGADGAFRLALGGVGGGPGEFQGGNPCGWAGLHGDAWVEDRGRRWHHFNGDGSFVATHRSTSNLGCGRRTWMHDGRLFAITRGHYVVHDLDDTGELVPEDTVWYPEVPRPPMITWVAPGGRSRSTMPLPFTHRSSWILVPDGTFWVSDGGGPYVIRHQSLEGDTLLIVERSYEPVPVPDDLRAQAIEDFRRPGWTPEGGFDVDQVLRVFPPFDRFWVATDGTLWVRRRLGGGGAGLDVFSAGGRYLGEAVVPPDFDRMGIRWIGDDTMLAVARDELDVQYVVRLRIRRPP